MNARLQQAQDWLRSLAPRERWLVLVCGVFVLITLAYLLVWEPLQLAHQRRVEGLQSSRALAQRLEVIGSQVGRGGGARINRNVSLLSAVDQATRSGLLPKPPSRLQPEGDAEVRIWLDDIPFDALLRWVSDLETRQGIRVDTAEIERAATPGAVSARLSLKR